MDGFDAEAVGVEGGEGGLALEEECGGTPESPSKMGG